MALQQPVSYTGYTDLTPEENTLLDLYKQAKKVKLKVPLVQHPTKTSTSVQPSTAKNAKAPTTTRKRNKKVTAMEMTSLHEKKPETPQQPQQPKKKMKVNLSGLLKPPGSAAAAPSQKPEDPTDVIKLAQRVALKVAAKESGKSTFKRPKVKHPGAGPIRPQQKRPSIGEDPQKGPRYDKEGILTEGDWVSKERAEPMILSLPGLSFAHVPRTANHAGATRHGNSVVVTATMPVTSKRFSLNISPSMSYHANHVQTTIYYHCNVVDSAPGTDGMQLIQNSFHKTEWHSQEDKSVRDLPIRKGRRFVLRITVLATGFELYVDDKLICNFAHRMEVRAGQPLYLIAPVKEQHFGDAEDVVIHSVWWGYVAPQQPMMY